MKCLNAREQHKVLLPLSGEVAAARDAVGRVYGATLRRLHGLIFETDIAKMPRFMLVTAQQKYMTLPTGDTPKHVVFRNAAAFSVAIMMAQAYELVNAYGCGSCLAFLETYLGPEPVDGFASSGSEEGDSDEDEDVEGALRGRPDHGRLGGRGRSVQRSGGQGRNGGSAKVVGTKKASGKANRKEDGRMTAQERASLFASAEFATMSALVQRCAEGMSHPKLPETVKLLMEHFRLHGQSSRVMVFCSYRYG